jgi:hypothetical protein
MSISEQSRSPGVAAASGSASVGLLEVPLWWPGDNIGDHGGDAGTGELGGVRISGISADAWTDTSSNAGVGARFVSSGAECAFPIILIVHIRQQ